MSGVDLLALAAQCEAATGSDRELDSAVWLHLPEQEGHAWKHGGDRFKHARQIAGAGFVPCYTASIDAATTLLPEGLRLRGFGEGKSGIWVGDLAERDHGHRCVAIGSGATPSLALTATCLKAHARAQATLPALDRKGSGK